MNKEVVDAYIESKLGAWMFTTQESTRFRLYGIIDLLPCSPAHLFTALRKRGLELYTMKTTFTNVGGFYDWLLETKQLKAPNNVFKDYLKKNSQIFKNAYQPEKLEVTFEEAAKLVQRIEDPMSKRKAIQLLTTGMRYTESNTIKDGMVTGKGGKRRRVFAEDSLKYDRTSRTFSRHLSKVGLKPHTLRKLAATKLAGQGVPLIDLMEIFGWRSMQTAASYLQPQREEALLEIMKKLKIS